MPRFGAFCLFIVWAGNRLHALSPGAVSTITGTVDASSWPAPPSVAGISSVRVALVPLELEVGTGHWRLTKLRFLGAEDAYTPPGSRAPEGAVVVDATPQRSSGSSTAEYLFSVSVPSSDKPFAVLAFVPNDRQLWLDFSRPQWLGWHAPLLGCDHSSGENEIAGDDVCVQPVFPGSKLNRSIILRVPTPMPVEGRIVKVGDNGAFGIFHPSVPGRPAVLRVRGTAYERGWAHGNLLAAQIITFFNFFVLEEKVRSEQFFRERFGPALLARVALSRELSEGARGLLNGMKASGLAMTTILGTEFGMAHWLALSAYSDESALAGSGQHTSGADDGCSQFIFWGNSSKDGQTITGRNMDGENDVRKVTVTHFVLHAVEPTEPGLARYVHAMWPGFLGTSSGVNEDGLYAMENAGCRRPAGLPTKTSLARDVIASILLTKGAASQWSPSELEKIVGVAASRSSGGGACPNGCIMVTAAPFSGQKDGAGIIYEGDQYGGIARVSGDAAPRVTNAIMATNHFHKYRMDRQNGPKMCNGLNSTFSSLWRYEAGSNHLEAWGRHGKLAIGFDEMTLLLQTVGHGTTEHSIIVRPRPGGNSELWVAVASANGAWDAAFEKHMGPLKFEDFFAAGDLGSVQV